VDIMGLAAMSVFAADPERMAQVLFALLMVSITGLGCATADLIMPFLKGK